MTSAEPRVALLVTGVIGLGDVTFTPRSVPARQPTDGASFADTAAPVAAAVAPLATLQRGAAKVDLSALARVAKDGKFSLLDVINEAVMQSRDAAIAGTTEPSVLDIIFAVQETFTNRTAPISLPRMQLLVEFEGVALADAAESDTSPLAMSIAADAFFVHVIRDATAVPAALPFAVADASGAALQLRQSKRVLVMCGAGISVAAGIPDFRTPGIGLYSKLDKYDLPEPADLFTLEYLEEKPEVFYLASKEMNLWPGSFPPTMVHHFLKLLQDRGQLLRAYTQNIDGLERLANLDPELLVEAHGTYASAHCIKCRRVYSSAVVKSIADRGEVPRCDDCTGIVKPDVVFFGEQLPQRFHECLGKDIKNCDMLIVIGTSLVVYPFAAIAEMVPASVPRLLLNMEPAGRFDIASSPQRVSRDLFLSGDCQASVERICEALNAGDAIRAMHAAGRQAHEARAAAAAQLGRQDGA